jgi:hypothetical protein
MSGAGPKCGGRAWGPAAGSTDRLTDFEGEITATALFDCPSPWFAIDLAPPIAPMTLATTRRMFPER